MAERVGFEPTIPVKVCPLSRRIVSTPHAPLRKTVMKSSAKTEVPRSARNDKRMEVLTTSDQQLTTVSKERLQHFRAAARQHSAANLDLMVQLRMIQNLHHRKHRASFRVVRAIYQAVDAGMHHRTGAHCARFNCNKQLAVFQAMVTNGCTSLAQRDHLGVGSRIKVSDISVPSPSHDPAVSDHHCAHWNLSRFKRTLCAAEGLFHPKLVRMNLVRVGLSSLFCLLGAGCGCFL